ncbi:MAG: hypothetical protein A2991_04280 [Candidatus Terrybacteria bacterium RIFCSPLOWO2_01_FULL_58_14]|uniref:GIY-YIG domain-containing protein n=2 Tax=Candidatus Terryibacteriota TaxID=1817920 RepID=A0A1G2PY46_9BACT|nr:MAG: hypothetical protein A2682_03430 [Candidatus Terrybacteria bacterium RIFCSPHIGHO2_01_FULL_58_15]OHA52512.1 MAG: hypothetical protein A2991_04280 [Candidatus Terrybacteria bacterium RIFCSPLOWO2_01_FULL_58_14]
MRPGYVYILQSPNCQRWYIGSTIDLEKRVREHNANRVSATRKKGPWLPLFVQEYETLQSARKIEAWLKRQKSRLLLQRIIREGNIAKQISRGVA